MFFLKGYGTNNIKTIAVVSTITALSVIIITWYKNKRKNKVPQKWRPVGKLTNVFLYPLKSGHRKELQCAECSISGLKQITEPGKYQLCDRICVVYKKSAKECKTARTLPKLILIEVTVDDENNLVINAPGMETLRLDIFNILDKKRRDRCEEIVTWWGEETFHVIDCGEEAATWVGKYLTDNGVSSDLRFGLHDGDFRRPLNKTLKEYAKTYPNITYNSMGIYADLTSFMLINQASVNELVARLPDYNISVNNFRPNFVVSDENLLPFEEDNWEWVKIGDVVFNNVKPCTRCILTTINPEAGTRNKNLEPLKTLRSYRIVKDLLKLDSDKDSPVMGVYLGLVRSGVIKVGDTVSVPIVDNDR